MIETTDQVTEQQSTVQVVSITLEAVQQRTLTYKSGLSFIVQPDAVSNLTVFQLIGSAVTEHEPTTTPDHSSHKLEHALTSLNSSEEAAAGLLAVVKKVQDRQREEADRLAVVSQQCHRSVRTQLVCSAKTAYQKTCDTFKDFAAEVHQNMGRIHFSGAGQTQRVGQSTMTSAHEYHEIGDEKLAAILNEAIDCNFTVTVKKVDQDATSPSNPLVEALEVLAGALGINALIAFIRRRFSSLRKRVERLADREERRVARQYRRAARREAMRQRWRAVKGVFCRLDSNGNYEEKRALILEAASAESLGSTLVPSSSSHETIVRGRTSLMYAQELAAAIMRGTLGSATVVVAGPRHSSDARSRTSTLPSYHSDQLPEYSSDLEDDAEHVTNGFRRYPPSVGSNATTVCTPDTSLPTLSLRPSQETLRTSDGSV